ncbi:hypothetical protein D3C75_657870 [compost metagenome]
MFIHGGVDFVSADVQIIFSQPEPFLSLINRKINKGLITLFAFRRLIAIIHHLGLIHLFLGDVVLIIHKLQHDCAPLFGELRITQRIVTGRPLRHRCQRSHFPQLQIGQVALAKITDRRCLNTVNRSAERNTVKIHRNNFIFGLRVLQRNRNGYLSRLTEERLVTGQKDIFGELLGDGTAALHHAACCNILHRCTADGPEIDALVIEEAFILRGHEGVDQLLGNIFIFYRIAFFQ